MICGFVVYCAQRVRFKVVVTKFVFTMVSEGVLGWARFVLTEVLLGRGPWFLWASF